MLLPEPLHCSVIRWLGGRGAGLGERSWERRGEGGGGMGQGHHARGGDDVSNTVILHLKKSFGCDLMLA